MCTTSHPGPRIGDAERVCSGQGLPNLYASLKGTRRAPESARVAHLLATTDDPTPVIVDAALETPPDLLCAAALTTFVSILGAETGNLALESSGHRRRLCERGHPAADPASALNGNLHGGVPAEGAYGRPARPRAGAGGAQHENRPVWRRSAWAGPARHASRAPAARRRGSR